MHHQCSTLTLTPYQCLWKSSAINYSSTTSKSVLVSFIGNAPNYHYLHISASNCHWWCTTLPWPPHQWLWMSSAIHQPETTTTSAYENHQICNHSSTPFMSVLMNVISNVTKLPIPPHQCLWMSSARYKPANTSLLMLVNIISNATTLPLPLCQCLWMSSTRYNPPNTSPLVLMNVINMSPIYHYLHISACECHQQGTTLPIPPH